MFVLLLTAGLKAQEVQEIKIDQLLERVNTSSDTVYVVNFWATWCHPCVEELPIFASDELHQLKQSVKVLLVSLDFKSLKEKQLIPFVKKKAIKQEVLLVDERNPNEWINKIDSSWTGAIPATIVYNGGNKVFHEGELDLEQLLAQINSINQ